MDSIEDMVQDSLQMIRDLKIDAITDQQKTEYKKRKLIAEV